MYVLIEDNKVVANSIDKLTFPMAIEAPDDIIFGDLYVDGEFQRVAPRPEPVVIPPQERREQCYETLACISWESRDITVDQANKICMSYMIEDNEKHLLLKPLIIDAKTNIRELYPDEVI